jgi:hypothetical protein
MDAAANLPAAQLVHAAAPTDGLKLPAAQASHAPPLGPEKPGVHVHDASDALPDAEVAFAGQPVQTSELLAATITENLPAAHAWHAAEDEAPTVGENVPAPQSLHDCAAVDAAANLPAAQLVHTPPACAANLPAAQLVQSLPASDPAGEDLPAAQSVHAASPTEALKLPAAHAWHAPPADLEYPTLHLLHAPVTLPSPVVVLDGHGGAAEHACVPGAPLNVPAAHGAHALPLGPVCPGAHVHALPPAASAS